MGLERCAAVSNLPTHPVDLLWDASAVDTQVPTLLTLLPHKSHITQLNLTAQLIRLPVQVLKCYGRAKITGYN